LLFIVVCSTYLLPRWAAMKIPT